MKKLFIILISIFGLSACIKNDVPFPYVFGEIFSLTIEGQNGHSSISTENQTVEIIVPFGTDKSQLSIADFEITEGATCSPDINEVEDFSSPVKLTISTYQDYEWTVTVIEDDFEIDFHQFKIKGQTSSEIEIDRRRIEVIIPDSLEIKNLSVISFDYAPKEIIVSPNPSEVHDFSSPVSFFFDDIEWIVEVQYEDDEIEEEIDGNQILYSDFQKWYYGGRKANESSDKRKFYLPGENFDDTPWRTGDVGAADLFLPASVKTVKSLSR
ncbi:hypothetical protein KMW28_22690 [Flammeovirga yaeyamensis]|uniref:Lipoprotein n=1 Tax=Flammeovirga yaeyamensis TaxID=367791 RepID=A0AAX1NCM8_9BACT|nr:hypothetical protein [Flammeovirga yaeyamensis]MBB3696830.1 hypothetical protein [Flammeovirga yaeyamensis]NMF33495.1 hypothetical protein [Flammeovirga yaeyamensis]QWG05232.1 hypothetical protein KMW28_22690 [Flammeovirga yaeyamensis]